MRGAEEIRLAMLEAQKAADRNNTKPHYSREGLKALLDKVDEERDELREAILSGDKQRILEELGDFLWTGIMAAAINDPWGILLESAEAEEKLAEAS